MKNLQFLLHQPLVWSFKKKKIILSTEKETIVELNEEKLSKASFEFNGKEYTIRKEGFWNIKTIIENDGRQILIMKWHFLSTKGKIEFENGNNFICKLKNSPLAKLVFYDNYEKEILFYKLDAMLKPKTIMKIVDNTIHENILLMLIILGAYSFKAIVKENEASDLITMTAGA